MSLPSYSLVLVGSGFASSFFLHRTLARADPSLRVLILERGPAVTHRDLLRDRSLVSRGAAELVTNRTPAKPWLFDVALGGTSNSWFGNTPRMTVEDFQAGSLFGRGRDWPVRYAELEPYYCDAEDLLGVAGGGSPADIPRSRPFPQPAHTLSEPDRRLCEAFPQLHFALPCARPTRPTGRRPACCGTGFCNLCPVDSKFTVLNELAPQLDDPRVEVLTDALVEEVETAGGVATAVRFSHHGTERRVAAEVVALGANAIFNPFILLRSGLDDGLVGRGLCEQMGVVVDVSLDGLHGFQGSTAITGLGYMLYGRDQRAHRAGGLIETWNTPFLRREPGRWRERLPLKVVFEEEPRHESAVQLDPSSPARPVVVHAGPSTSTARAATELPRLLDDVLATLPVERIDVRAANPSEGHILCTTPMGDDPRTSVVDRTLRHHRVRNLLLLGSGAFPSCPAANPTLTICALSLWAADRLRAG